MEILRCKMCGGDLDITEGARIIECRYCGTKIIMESAIETPRVSPLRQRARVACNNMDEVYNYIKDNYYKNGELIKAIKFYREQTGVGLKEAKDAVDEMWSRMG